MVEPSAWRRGLQDVSAGTIAGVAGTVVGHPLDTVKVRMQLENTGRGIARTYMDMARAEGHMSVWKGLSAPVAGTAFIQAISFAAYGQAQVWIERANQQSSAPSRPASPLTLSQLTLAGAFSGLAAGYVSSPIELVKIRMQDQRGRVGAAAMPGPAQTFRAIARERGGFRAFHHGLALTLFRDIPGWATYFGTYELARRSFSKLQGVPTSMLHPLGVMMAGGIAGMASFVINYPVDVIKTRWQQAPVGMYASSLACTQDAVATEGRSILMRGCTAIVVRAFPVNAITFLVYEWSMTRLADLSYFSAGSYS